MKPRIKAMMMRWMTRRIATPPARSAARHAESGEVRRRAAAHGAYPGCTFPGFAFPGFAFPGFAFAAVAMLGAVGCASTNPGVSARVGEAERTRATVQAQEVGALAPQALAAADAELRLAKSAAASGDAASAELHADRALASYRHAVVLARLARATQEAAAAKEALGRAAEEAGRYTAQRTAIDREVEDLEKRMRIAREAHLPPPSGRADPDRERARVVAAQSLVTQARLLCSAARLVSNQAAGLDDAEASVTLLERQIDGAKAPLTIDPAARARAACLTSLTKARRAATPGSDEADALLGELSQSIDPKAAKSDGLAPSRDERGVVVTLRSLFSGERLSAEGEASLKDLGRVAAAHPSFALQVVLHDAVPPGPSEMASNQKRGEAISHALVQGGATAERVRVEQARARSPIVDPKDARRRDRNARVEIVFVSPGR